ncbi:MAG: hypothetical protein IJE18_04975 [Bacteroidaceae bacterium]|nr:hypothetical protein [Bacteroidaceae bacterium]
MPRSNVSIVLTAIAIAIGFYLFNSVVPYYSDDWWHTFVHHPQGKYPTQQIEGIYDLATSQINHYINKNGRMPVTMLTQSIVSTCPKSIFNILNTLFFLLACFLLSRCYGGSKGATPSRLLLSAGTIFFVLPGHYDTSMWATGAIYYLWVSVYIMWILLLWRQLQGRTTTRPHNLLLLLAGILAGWSNEALSFGLAAGIVCDMAIGCREQRIAKSQYYLAGGIVIGVAMIIISPGSWERTQWVTHNLHHISLYTPLFTSLLIPLALVIALFTMRQWDKNLFLQYFSRHRICITASLTLVPICIATWQFSSRSCYGMTLFASIPLLAIINENVLPLIMRQRILKILSIAILAVGTIALFIEHNKVEACHRTLIAQYTHSNDGIVALDIYSPAWYARPYTLDVGDEYTRGWTARHMAAYYKGQPLQLMCTELYYHLHHPEEFFVEHNRVNGNAEFYTTPTLPVYLHSPLYDKPSTLLYTYTPVSTNDNVPLHSKVLRWLYPQRYPLQEVLPAYYKVYDLGQDGVYYCIDKSIYRNVTSIDIP